MVSPTVTCKNVIEDNQICNHTQQIGQDMVCSNCGADLINQYINDVMDPTSKYKLIFNGDIVSKASSSDAGKGAPVITITKEFL